MSQKPSKRQRFKNFILRRKLNVLGLLVITVMSALITLVCAIRGFVYTDILFIVSLLLVALCFVQSIKLKKSFRTIFSVFVDKSHHFSKVKRPILAGRFSHIRFSSFQGALHFVLHFDRVSRPTSTPSSVSRPIFLSMPPA